MFSLKILGVFFKHFCAIALSNFAYFSVLRGGHTYYYDYCKQEMFVYFCFGRDDRPIYFVVPLYLSSSRNCSRKKLPFRPLQQFCGDPYRIPSVPSVPSIPLYMYLQYLTIPSLLSQSTSSMPTGCLIHPHRVSPVPWPHRAGYSSVPYRVIVVPNRVPSVPHMKLFFKKLQVS
jgi:hypothetical protein